MKAPPVRREDLAPDACLCDHCIGKCCRYFSFPIPTPRSRDDYEVIRGYLAYGETVVYVEKRTWYLVVLTRCKYLDADNRCAVYFHRPRICREYTTAECEYDSEWIFEKVFETPEQIWEYVEGVAPGRSSPPGGTPMPPIVVDSFRVPIQAPATRDDFDAIRWYLAHGRTSVSVSKGRWYVEVRPRPSGRADPGFPREPGSSEKLFESPEQLWEYAEMILPPRPRRSAGPLLPIITPG